MQTVKKTQAGFSIVEVTVGIVIVAIIGFVGWYVLHAKKSSDTALTNASQSTPAIAHKANASNSSAAGTDNASLNQDLQGIGNSQDQATKDQNTANGGLNDQQNEVSVPTN